MRDAWGDIDVSDMPDRPRYWTVGADLKPFDTEFEARGYAAAHDQPYLGRGTEYDMQFKLLTRMDAQR